MQVGPPSLQDTLAPLFDILSKDALPRDGRVEALSSRQVKEVLDKFFKEVSAAPKSPHVFSDVSHLAHILTLEKLQTAVKEEFPNLKDALTTAQAMLKEAQLYLEKEKGPSAPPLVHTVERFVEKMISHMEHLLSLVGMKNLFHSTYTEEEADAKFQKIVNILSLVYYLALILVNLIKAHTSALIVGGTLLFIGTLSLFVSFMKRGSTHIPYAENWTSLARAGLLLKPSFLTNKTTDTLSHLISSHALTPTLPLLIEKKGSCKLENVHAFAYALQTGAYRELGNKQLFYIPARNLFDIHSSDEEKNPASCQILEAIERNKEDCIFIFDDIHLIETLPNKNLSLRLKNLLEQGKDSPCIIGVTTEEGMPHLSELKKICTPLSSDDPSVEDLVPHLERFLIQKAPHVLVERGALFYLASKTKDLFSDGTSLLDIALKVLSRCVYSIQNPPKTALEQQIDSSRKKRDALYVENMLTHDTGYLPYPEFGSEIEDIEKEIRTLEKALQGEQETKARLSATQDLLFKSKSALLQSVLKISRIQQSLLTPENKVELSEFLLLSHFLLPSLYKTLRSTSEGLSAKVLISKTLIDEMLQQEKQLTTGFSHVVI